jgi:hypothetical protein
MKTTKQICLHFQIYYTGMNIAVAISYSYVPLEGAFLFRNYVIQLHI